MMKFYNLEHRVTFVPETNSLHAKDESGMPYVVTLNAPTAKCLHLLLMKRTLTTPQELYGFAWDDNGASTTPNNLYQNISLIRKALSNTLGGQDDYIVTVPRKGFYINPELSVSEDVAGNILADATLTDTKFPSKSGWQANVVPWLFLRS